VRAGETIALARDGARTPSVVEEMEADRRVPAWLERQDAGGRVARLPTRPEVELLIDEDRIVAFYSRSGAAMQVRREVSRLAAIPHGEGLTARGLGPRTAARA
jgi:hypothetical protein